MSDTAILELPGTALRLHSAAVLSRSKSTAWAVRTPDNRLLGIGQGLGDILRTMQEHGTLTPKEIQARLGGTWTLPEILNALASLRRYRIILTADEEETTSTAPTWSVDHDGPFVLKLCFNRPEALFRALRGVVAPLRKSWLRWLAPMISLAGLVLLMQLVIDPNGALYQPLSLRTYGMLLLSMVLTTAVHELAHGLTLTACGALPHRVGVMIFYFSPAAFCDVTEAWLLPRRERVAVAFAGIIVQTSIGAVALLACLLLGGNGFLAWYGASTYLIALSNLIPFLRLDGYVALVGAIDQSGLRRRSVTALHDRIAGIPTTEPVWVALFGIGCLATPFVIVWGVVSTMAPNLINGGATGRLMLSALIGFCLTSLLIKLIHGMRKLRPTQQARLALAGTLTAFAVLLTPIPTSTSFGYLIERPGVAIALNGNNTVGSAPVAEGTVVTFHHSGLINGSTLGTGTVTGTKECTVPVRAVSPILSDALMPPATCLTISTDLDLAVGSTGRVITETVHQPLARIIRKQLGPILPGGIMYSDS